MKFIKKTEIFRLGYITNNNEFMPFWKIQGRLKVKPTWRQLSTKKVYINNVPNSIKNFPSESNFTMRLLHSLKNKKDNDYIYSYYLYREIKRIVEIFLVWAWPRPKLDPAQNSSMG